MTGPDLAVWLLATAAAYRLWRLLALDDLPGLADGRQWLLDRHPNRWTDAIVCPWCLGFWCCVAVFAAVHTVDPYSTAVAYAIHVAAASTVVGLTGSNLDG